MDPWLGPFEQDVEQFYRVELQWTDRWTTGIVAMVSLDFATIQPICHYTTSLPLSHQFNNGPSLFTSVVIALTCQ